MQSTFFRATSIASFSRSLINRATARRAFGRFGFVSGSGKDTSEGGSTEAVASWDAARRDPVARAGAPLAPPVCPCYSLCTSCCSACCSEVHSLRTLSSLPDEAARIAGEEVASAWQMVRSHMGYTQDLGLVHQAVQAGSARSIARTHPEGQKVKKLRQRAGAREVDARPIA